MASPNPPAQVKSTANDYDDDKSPKDLYLGTTQVTSSQWKEIPITVTDMRQCNETFTLDKHGFQLVPHKSAEKNWYDDDIETRIVQEVYPETAELVKKVTGATHVAAHAHIVRQSMSQQSKALASQAQQRADSPMTVLPPAPATNVHVDQSYLGARTFFDDRFSPSDAARLSKTRWGIINVWRPFRLVTRDNLCVGDWNSVTEEQLREVTMHFPRESADGGNKFSNAMTEGAANRTMGTWRVAARADGKENEFYYAPRMTPDEVLMIKCYDTKVDGRARLSPHTSFQWEGDCGDERKSVEIRCLVCWEDQSPE